MVGRSVGLPVDLLAGDLRVGLPVGLPVGLRVDLMAGDLRVEGQMVDRSVD